ncbi:MAG: beta strand repeat-containing protein [Patescibacteria group bacterium]
MPSIAGSANTTIFFYYDDPTATTQSDGSTTFNYFDQGNSLSNWTTAGSAGQNTTTGNPAPSYYANSSNGDYMYNNASLTPGEVITFNGNTTALGDFFFLTNSTGAGQMYRFGINSGWFGFATTNSWTSWGAPSGTSPISANTWYKFQIVITSSSTASLYYKSTTGDSPSVNGTLVGTYTITDKGGYMGFVGDGASSTDISYLDNIIVRQYSSPEPTVAVDSTPPSSVPSTNTAYTNTNENTISWSSVSGATSYKVYRGTSSGGENAYFVVNNGSVTTLLDSGHITPTSGSPPTTGGTAPTISASSTSAVGGDIPYNTTYYYKVTATTSGGETLPSTEVTLTANAPVGVPTGIVATNTTISTSTITSGAWINHQHLTMGATISSPNSLDTLHLLVEVQPTGTAFTNSTTTFVTSGVGVYESAAYTYTGTALSASLVVSNLPSNMQYHWQATVLGDGGASSWVAMGGSPDFGVDVTSPLSNGISMIAWSGQPTKLFSSGFESGNILTTSSPAGSWTSDGGTSLPLIQNNTQGSVLQGSYSVNMATSSGGTSYIQNNTFNTSSAQLRMYIDIKSVAFAAVGDSIVLGEISGSSGTIATVNLLDTSSGPVIETINSVGTTSYQGTTVLSLNRYNVIVFDLSISSTTGSLSTYLNGISEGSLTSQNTGVSNMTTLTLGAVTDSTSDSINMNMDSINVENTSGLTQLSYDTATPYQYTAPYFEFLGGYDQGSGIANYGVYFGQTATDYPVTTQTTEGYLSPSLSTSGMYYFDVVLYDNVSNTSVENVNFEYNFYPPPVVVPNAPTTLEQLQSNGTAQITNDTWTTNGITTNVVFQFSMSSPNSTDTLTPEIELQPNGTAFTGTPNYSGSAVSYSGTTVTGIVDVTGLTNCTGYHWQAFVKNSNGLSTPVVFNSTTPNFSVSNSAPTAGSVYDGSVSGTETNTTASISSLGANWTGFSDTCSGLASTPYTVAVGTTPGGTNIYAYSSSSVVLNNPSPYNTISLSSLPLHTGQIYYVSVQAINNVGLTTTVTSSGQYVVPTLSFSLNSSLVNLGNWNSTNAYTTTNTSTLSVLTDAYNGYTISAYETSLLTSMENSSYTIPNFSAGSYASPALWPSGDYGFGYTSSATDINGVNLFSNGTLYAPFSSTGPGDVVAENQTNITGANYSTTPTTYTITYKAAVQASQQAGSYQTNIVYTVVSSF